MNICGIFIKEKKTTLTKQSEPHSSRGRFCSVIYVLKTEAERVEPLQTRALSLLRFM